MQEVGTDDAPVRFLVVADGKPDIHADASSRVYPRCRLAMPLTLASLVSLLSAPG